MKKKIIWISPSDYKKAENIMSIWEKEMLLLGWDTRAKQEEADFIFCGSESQLDKAIKMRGETKIPIICYFWGFPWFRLIDPVHSQHYSNRLQLMKQVSGFLTPSQTVTLQLADFGFTSVVIIPGIDYRTIEKIKPVSDRLPNVVGIGRLVPHKAFDVLVNTIAQIEPGLKLDIIGRGDLEDDLMETARINKVALKIHDMNDIEKFIMLKNSGVFVTCSEYEGFGAPIPEAMACNVPVIANRISIFTELFTDYVLYYENEQALGRLIVRLLSEPDFYLSRVRLQSVLVQSFYMSEAAKRLEDIFLKITDGLIKDRLANKIRKDPSSAKEVYEEEAKRNWGMSAHRFDPHWLRHWRVDFALKALRGKNVLDLGCSYGAYSIRFAEKGFNVTAVDISSFYIDKVREYASKYNVNDLIRTVNCDAHELPFVDSHFDSVWVGELLEHVPEPEKIMKEALRVVKKNGVVVFSTPFQTHHYDTLHLHVWKSKEHFMDAVLKPLSEISNINRLDLIAEGNLTPSVIFGIIEKR